MEWSDEQMKELEMLAHKSPVPCASKGAGRAERGARPLPPGGGRDRLRAPTECWHLSAQLPSSGNDGLRGGAGSREAGSGGWGRAREPSRLQGACTGSTSFLPNGHRNVNSR